jgi:transcriptional regulator with XRE-family HTH domain
MKDKTMAEVITARRKALGMTQKDLAEKMNITDKAVSKWERGLACPDTASIPRLAQVLGISLEELMACETVETPGHKGKEYLLDLTLKAVPLAMGIAVTVTAVLGELDTRSGLSMLGIGLACVGIRQLREK